MNSESINAALINELVEDSIQRVSTTFNMAAVLRPNGRVRARAPVEFTARAELVSLWKTLVRSGRTVIAPTAQLTILGTRDQSLAHKADLYATGVAGAPCDGVSEAEHQPGQGSD